MLNLLTFTVPVMSGPAKLLRRMRFHNTATISQTTTVAMNLIKNGFAGAH
jgi:hypothetical protein